MIGDVTVPGRRTHRRRARGLAPAALLAGAVLGLVGGCGDPDLLDPTEDPLAADREQLVDDMTGALASAADQLGAGAALGTRVDTWCSAGEDTWEYTDDHRSTCQLSLTSGHPLSTGVGVGVDHLREYGLPVTQVTGVRLYSAEGNGNSITLSFRPASTPVDPARSGSPAGYYTDTEGSDWQDGWSAQSPWHPFVIVASSDAVLGEQPW
ncbi:hypothetical protein SAMN05660464_2576 [Geodermatophilus dictyosporus]|uniref:Uncharacterized protein n=1 Tax=Geodermatophilus dictyosporus TaxID=1523247 RepID=A0A1I5NKM0_9ACTN|nr:hypothetical protein SAMN05660464_2576 [Geodermatophilus dictyosporus]